MSVTDAQDRPAISVIVPCHNVAEYLDRSLGSLQRQTFEDFEIIAVDDGSTDATAEALARWARGEPRLRIHRQENQGPHLARLAGIECARGAWVGFMDADDEVMPAHLESLWQAVDERTGVAVGAVVAIAPDGCETRYGPAFDAISGQEAAVRLLIGHHTNGLYPCCNKLYRRDLLQKTGLMRPRISYGEDFIFNLRVFLAMEDALVAAAKGEPTYRYLAREGSLMQSVSKRHVDEFFDLWDERDSTAETILCDPALRRRYEHMRLLNVMDFAGVVYRSGRQEWVRRLAEGLEHRAWPLNLPWREPLAAVRWLKWRLRMMAGRAGLFPRWLY